MRRLVITADDFGAAPEVNEAVEQAHVHGVLTAASLMVAAPAAADAIARARRLPSLRIGLHLVLVEGRPLLPTAAVSRLVDPSGAFRGNLALLGAAIAASAVVRRQVAAEITAQFAAFLDSGLKLDHCNAHKHFHLHPVIGRLLIDIGPRFGMRAVRVPLEPPRVLARLDRSAGRQPLVRLPALLLRRRLQAAGLVAADQCFGNYWSGRMTRPRLLALLANLPPGLTEIYLHPAAAPFPAGVPGYRYREELEALLAPEIVAACRDSTLSLGGFGDLLAPAAIAPHAPLHPGGLPVGM